MESVRWSWKQGLVDCMDMIQQHEKGEEVGYEAAYHTLHGTGELDCPRYRKGWADGLEHYKYLKGKFDEG